MPKLNQIIAVVTGKKTETAQVLTEAHNRQLKPVLLDGFERNYKPFKDDETGASKLPPESKKVQITVPQVIEEVRAALVSSFDAVHCLDTGNTQAKGDIAVDGKVILKDCPVLFMIFLEKQLEDLHTFASKLPVLDASEIWKPDPGINGYQTDPQPSIKMAKVFENHLLHPPTVEHPAQVQVHSVDRPIGTWTTIKKSGAISLEDRNATVKRIGKLKEAVKMARELANGIEIKQSYVGSPFMDYIFSGKLPA